MESNAPENKTKKRLIRAIFILLAGAGGFFIVRAVTTDRTEPNTQAQTIASENTPAHETNPNDQLLGRLITTAANRLFGDSQQGIETAVVTSPELPPLSSSLTSSSSSERLTFRVPEDAQRPSSRASRPQPANDNRPRIIPVARAAEVVPPSLALEQIRFGTKVVGGTPLITVDVIAHNTGTKASALVPIKIFSAPASGGGKSMIGELSIPSIASGATQSASSSFVAPSTGANTQVCISSSPLFFVASANNTVCQSLNLPSPTPPPISPPPITTPTCVVPK